MNHKGTHFFEKIKNNIYFYALGNNYKCHIDENGTGNYQR